jgi:outer membrane protein TolC
MSHLIKLLLALLPVAALQAQHDDVLQVLKRIEANNLELQAARHATDAQKAEARTQLNLDNPELSFSAMQGPDNAKSHEFAIMQGFAFPTHYVAMNRQVKHQNAQADATHALVRRNILLQAHMLCLELIANEKLMLCLQRRDTTLAHLARLYDQAMKQGDVSAIDASRLATQQIALQADLQQARQQHTELQAQLQALNGGAPLNFSANSFPEAS